MQAATCCPSDGASAFIRYLYLKYHPYCYTSNTNVQACKQPHAAHPTRPRHLGLVFPCSDKKATIIYTLTDVMSIPMPLINVSKSHRELREAQRYMINLKVSQGIKGYTFSIKRESSWTLEGRKIQWQNVQCKC
jgi:hypothetical protein